MGVISKGLTATGKKIARTNMPTSMTALLEGKNIAAITIAIKKLEMKDSLTKSDSTMLRKLKAKLKEVRKKQSSEVPPKADRPKDKRQPSKPDMSMAMKNGGMPMVMKDGKKIPAFAADGVGKMMHGGMAKKNKKATPGYAYGGMTTSKPRTGNTDYRMGGMFMKSGKK